MIHQSLGQKIKELRDTADLSLRELAKILDVSAPFLSDVELGRRFPSDDVLAALAKALKVPLEALRQYDSRQPVADLKKMIESNPGLGFAFRTVVEDMKDGKLTPEALAKRLLDTKRKKNA
ncbi:MAG: helix-turn-helix transcriptional regulator [Chthoniobacteraceae bacterium]